MKYVPASLLLLSSLASSAACSSGGSSPPSTPPVEVFPPPPPAQGIQLHTPDFDVPAGEEIQRCFYFKSPNDVDLDVVEIETRMTTGSHHVTLYQTDVDAPDHFESCFALGNVATADNPGGLSMVFNVARESVTWPLPAGVAMRLKAHRQLVMQVHYVNATTQTTPQGAKVYWNLHTEPDPSKVQTHLGIVTGSDTSIVIPPHSSPTFDSDCPVAKPRFLAAAAGHFHSRGKRFDIFEAQDGTTFDPAPIYTSTDWSEAPFKTYDAPLPLAAASVLRYQCAYENDGDQSFVFGPHVETQEHCIATFYMYPWDEPESQLNCPVSPKPGSGQ